MLHPTFGLKSAIFALQLFVDNVVTIFLAHSFFSFHLIPLLLVNILHSISLKPYLWVTNLQVWKKVVYLDRLLQLFRYVPREQLTIPDFVFQLSNHTTILHLSRQNVRELSATCQFT